MKLSQPIQFSYFHAILLLLLMACDQSEKAIEEHQHTAVGVLDAVISDDARFSIVSSVNHGVGYWDLKENKLLFNWSHNAQEEQGIIATGISPDNKRAITADSRNFVIWNTTSGKSYGYWRAPARIRAIAISDLGRYVLLGLEDGRAIHIDMNTGRRLEFTGHRAEAIASVDLSANGVWAFTGGNDYRAILWNTITGKPKRLFEHKTRVTLMKLNQSGTLAFTAGTLGNAHIWDLTNGEKLASLALKKREYIVVSASFSHNNKLLVTGAPGKNISLWNVKDGKKIKQWRARTRQQWKPSGAIVYAVAFTQDDKNIYSESSAGYGERWVN
ncbi:MAG: WD40 repeat protein [Polaribacter sp.]|jgi:WD40 repeat protein